MTDSKNTKNSGTSKNQSKVAKVQPKVLSNSLRLKSPHGFKSRQNVSTILNRLPFLRALNETQNQLLAIAPVWHQWCSSQESQDKTRSHISEFASLASINADELCICCTQSTIATLLKFKQSSLLEELHQKGFTHIHKVRIQMSLSRQTSSPQSTQHMYTPTNLSIPQTQSHIQESYIEESHSKEDKGSSTHSSKAWPKPSSASVKSIEATQSLIKNEQLAASLKRLAETLKKAT